MQIEAFYLLAFSLEQYPEETVFGVLVETLHTLPRIYALLKNISIDSFIRTN